MADRKSRGTHRQGTAARAKRTTQRTNWSAEVTRTSDALDLDSGVFKGRPVEIAQSLKRSAERSARRKGTPYQSAMSMLTFYINRAGKSLPRRRVEALERAKVELRRAFGRED